ncbi:MAG: hypothetical protein WAM82_24190 [Thermoanaerobaculia bacterium]
MRKAFQAGPSFPRLAFAVLLGAAILARPAGARDQRWRPFGPGGGTVTGLATDPRDPQVVYAAAYQGLFASRDGGRTWTGFSLPPPINVVAVAPGQPATIYAGGEKIFRSGDGGRTWQTVDGDAADLHALAVTSGRRPVVFALLSNDVRRSADDGRTWTFLPRPLVRPGLHGLAFDPTDPDLFYAATVTGVWRTQDDGRTWSRLRGGYFGQVATAGPGVLLAAGVCGLDESRNGGNTWQTVVPCTYPQNHDLGQIVSQL